MNYDLWGDPVIQELKRCNKCGVKKPVTDFTKSNGANYPRSYCKKCENELKKSRERIRKEQELPKADHKCPICLRTGDQVSGIGGKKLGPWCCDHNHKTNKFRGWLCHDCNRALGGFKENIESMIRAMEWLKKHESL